MKPVLTLYPGFDFGRGLFIQFARELTRDDFEIAPFREPETSRNYVGTHAVIKLKPEVVANLEEFIKGTGGYTNNNLYARIVDRHNGWANPEDHGDHAWTYNCYMHKSDFLGKARKEERKVELTNQAVADLKQEIKERGDEVIDNEIARINGVIMRWAKDHYDRAHEDYVKWFTEDCTRALHTKEDQDGKTVELSVDEVCGTVALSEEIEVLQAKLKGLKDARRAKIKAELVKEWKKEIEEDKQLPPATSLEILKRIEDDKANITGESRRLIF